jgi:hypothetical protein
MFTFLIFSNCFIFYTWMTVENTLLKYNYYDEIITNTNLLAIVHERLKLELPDYLLNNLSLSSSVDTDELTTVEIIVLDDIDKEELLKILYIYADILSQTFNPVWLEEQTLKVVGEVLSYSSGIQDDIELTFSLSERIFYLRQALFLALHTDYMPETILTSDDIDLIANNLISAAEIPEVIDVSDYLSKTGISSETEELLSAFRDFRRMMMLWPYIFFVLMVIFNILLVGVGYGLICSGAAVFLYSLIHFALLQLSRWVLLFSQYLAVKIYLDSNSVPLVTMINHIVEYTFELIMPIIIIPFLLGLIMLTTGVVICIFFRRADKTFTLRK